MKCLAYAVDVTPIPFVGFAAWCRDLPDVQAFGCDINSALTLAAASMEMVCASLVRQGQLPPAPTPLQPGERWLSPRDSTCLMGAEPALARRTS